MATDIIPDWAAIDSREFYEELFRYPLQEAELVVEDGRGVAFSDEKYFAVEDKSSND